MSDPEPSTPRASKPPSHGIAGLLRERPLSRPRASPRGSGQSRPPTPRSRSADASLLPDPHRTSQSCSPLSRVLKAMPSRPGPGEELLRPPAPRTRETPLLASTLTAQETASALRPLAREGVPFPDTRAASAL